MTICCGLGFLGMLESPDNWSKNWKKAGICFSHGPCLKFYIKPVEEECKPSHSVGQIHPKFFLHLFATTEWFSQEYSASLFFWSDLNLTDAITHSLCLKRQTWEQNLLLGIRDLVGATNTAKQVVLSFQAVMLDWRSGKHIGMFILHPIPLRVDI